MYSRLPKLWFPNLNFLKIQLQCVVCTVRFIVYSVVYRIKYTL